jgi:hypothetical protein
MIMPPVVPGRHYKWRQTSQKELHDEFVDQVVTLWDQGLDTLAIKETLHHPSQADCERALHVGLERRRKITWRQIFGQKEGREEDRGAGKDSTEEGGSTV